MNQKKLIAEAFSTFVFTSVLIRSSEHGNLQPVIVSLGFLIAIVLAGAVSGGHCNPATTVMLHLAGDPNVASQNAALGYVAAQVIGAVAALKLYQAQQKQ